MKRDVKCPYCDAWGKINHDDGYGYHEDERYQQECGDCGKTFVFLTKISFRYESEKADCLNGAEHDWKATNTFPAQYSKMRCSMCDEERNPTAEELRDILIARTRPRLAVEDAEKQEGK